MKDAAGEACALLNLGNCLSSRGEFAQAVPYYEQHLMLSQELGDVTAEAKACHFLGYAHYCLGNYREAVRYVDLRLNLLMRSPSGHHYPSAKPRFHFKHSLRSPGSTQVDTYIKLIIFL